MVNERQSSQQIILVDEEDNAIGSIEKIEAHQRGLKHRALSIFIFNPKGEMLLQQRAFSKYHSGGLWSNACCSHPFPNEATQTAASRRLNEEMGFTASLKKVFDFSYKASFANGLTENEFDHVFAGEYEGEIKPNPEEVAHHLFKPMEEIKIELQQKPEKYTEWFKIAFPKIEAWWEKKYRQ
jgi:isopentenyl-diphosphate delta-isomerase